MCLFRTPLFFKYRLTATYCPNNLPKKTWPQPPLPIGFKIWSSSLLIRKVSLMPRLSRYSSTLSWYDAQYIECWFCLNFCFDLFSFRSLSLGLLIYHFDYHFYYRFDYPSSLNLLCFLTKNLKMRNLKPNIFGQALYLNFFH